MSTIRVNTTSACYDVTIAPGLLGSIYPRLRKLTPGPQTQPAPRLFVVTSPEIWALWGKAFLVSFPKAEQPTTLFLPAGERYKRLAQVELLAQQLALAGADRDSILVALGGGIVGDVTGFLAAIYMRGIRYVGVPTTMLAMVDSSLGGKTGVDLVAGKNLIGAFHHPLAVFSDIDTLGTLPAAELRAGLQEAVKSGIIRDAKLFRFMEKNVEAILAGDAAALQKVVAACVKVKAEVVGLDEKESGLRMILNFGHTIGHAIEAATHYRKLLHGEAVAWGSIAALHLSLDRQRITPEEFARMANLVLRYGPIPAFKIAATPRADAEHLVALTYADKKKRSGRRAFVLATGIGSTEVVYDVTDAELVAATQSMLETMQQS